MTRANTKKSSGTKQRGVARSKPHSKPELVLETQISPNLAWMFPYLRRIQSKMPNLVLPKKIRSHKPNTQKIMRVLGNAYCHNQTIVIATHNQVTYLNRKGELRVKRIVRLPKSRMLDTLAHEIAHLTYPEHGYEHEEFTRAIFKTFGLKEKCPHCKGTGKVTLQGRY